jgi:prophage regulatory protein
VEPPTVAMRMLRLKDVIRVTGLARMTIWRLERKGDFPLRRQLGPRSVAWLERDVQEWMEHRPVAHSVVNGARRQDKREKRSSA